MMNPSLLLLILALSVSPAAAVDSADDWCGTLWKRSDYHGFAMQENWRAAMLEVGDHHGAAGIAASGSAAANASAAGKTAMPAKKGTPAMAGNPTGKRVRRKTAVDDGPIAPTVIAPVR